MTLTVGSLFSGIGGLDLGLERAGMKVIWQSEIDPFACKVLKKHWPGVPNHGDIKQIDWDTVERPDIICGGYPCQPFSLAGQRNGTDDPRHLWPWVRECISRLQPRYAILENVRGHLTLGGLQVIGELAEIGYDAEWRIVPASGVGAYHRRDRIIIVAYPNSQGLQRRTKTENSKRENSKGHLGPSCSNLANASGIRGAGWRGAFASDNAEVRQHAIRSAAYWEVEPAVGRMADGVSHRMDRLRGLGNAVVPQVAEYIGRLITTIG